MTPEVHAILDRMPDCDRRALEARFRDDAEMLEFSVQLWAASQRYETSKNFEDRERAIAEARDALNDQQDEAMLVKALRGGYGQEAKTIAEEMVEQVQPGTTRRALLRQARKVIGPMAKEAAR